MKQWTFWTSEPFKLSHETERYTQRTYELFLSGRRTRLPSQSLGLQEPVTETPYKLRSTSVHSPNILFCASVTNPLSNSLPRPKGGETTGLKTTAYMD